MEKRKKETKKDYEISDPEILGQNIISLDKIGEKFIGIYLGFKEISFTKKDIRIIFKFLEFDKKKGIGKSTCQMWGKSTLVRGMTDAKPSDILEIVLKDKVKSKKGFKHLTSIFEIKRIGKVKIPLKEYTQGLQGALNR